MDSGKLGQIYSVHVRQTHDAGCQGTLFSGFYHPLENGGGAMNDMGYKAAHILWNLLGMPKEVSCSTQYISPLSREWKAEESAVAVYSYENGTVAVAESGWMTPKYQCTLDVFGTRGCVTARDSLITYRIGEEGWKTVSEKDFPAAKPYPLNYWIENIQNDRPDVYYGVDEAMDVTRMIMAAYRAAAQTQKL
ncbi:MAG: hypothetical protein LUH19_07290 [Lachnospiraceae bacterium]|nr:hypothetical protein [Lachnospiraceae bacterium]